MFFIFEFSKLFPSLLTHCVKYFENSKMGNLNVGKETPTPRRQPPRNAKSGTGSKEGTGKGSTGGTGKGSTGGRRGGSKGGGSKGGGRGRGSSHGRGGKGMENYYFSDSTVTMYFCLKKD